MTRISEPALKKMRSEGLPESMKVTFLSAKKGPKTAGQAYGVDKKRAAWKPLSEDIIRL